jgi:hypothetical protein
MKWSKTWQMKFNIKKCVCMTISNKRNVIKFNYSMGGQNLDVVNEFKDLGILITTRLTWIEHIMNVKAKALRNLGYIKRVLGNSSPLKIKIMLYNALVKSVISYATPVWKPFKKYELILLEQVQRQATRYLVKYQDFSYAERLKKLNLLPLTYERDITDLITFYNMYYGLYDFKLNKLFLSENVRRGRILERIAGELTIIKCRTEACKNIFCVRVLYIWNKLPVEIQSIEPSMNARNKCAKFKNALKKYYIQLLNNHFDVNNLCTWVSYCTCYNCRQ